MKCTRSYRVVNITLPHREIHTVDPIDPHLKNYLLLEKVPEKHYWLEAVDAHFDDKDEFVKNELVFRKYVTSDELLHDYVKYEERENVHVFKHDVCVSDGVMVKAKETIIKEIEDKQKI